MTPVEKVLDRSVAGPGGCIVWTGATNGNGYGLVRVGDRLRYTHRVVCEPIPTGMTVDHLCRNRRCVNPAHLEVVTYRENILRGDTVAAHNAAKTACVNGHAFTPENTITDKQTGNRKCRTCARAACARWYRKQLEV